MGKIIKKVSKGVKSVVGGITGRTQAKAYEKAAEATNAANRVSFANQQYSDRLARRATAKESRIRRARIMQLSENSGVGGSSGELGAVSAVSSNEASSLAGQQARILAVKSSQDYLNRAAEYKSDIYKADAIRGMFDTAIGIAKMF